MTAKVLTHKCTCGGSRNLWWAPAVARVVKVCCRQKAEEFLGRTDVEPIQ